LRAPQKRLMNRPLMRKTVTFAPPADGTIRAIAYNTKTRVEG
jgi:hypothetical protein